MQKLLFFFTLFIPFWLLAQPFTIQGYVTDAGTGSPIANHSVTINSTTPSFPYSNTVMTNMVGFYSDAINVPATVPQIAFVVTTNDCNGNTFSYTLVYFVNGPNPAVANFQICGGSAGCQAYFTSGINGATASFQNQSQGGTAYFWDFGNGQTNNAMSPNVTYSQSGSYSVCLTVSDSLSGCIDTYCDTLTIAGVANCQADFVPTVSANMVYFTNTSTGLGNTTIYAWDFGDGTTDNTSSPIHTYSQSGTYYVCLTITTISAAGITCTSTYCEYVVVGSGGGGCQAYFTYGVNGGVVSFQNQSTPSGYFSNWNFGNGQTSSVQHPTQTYTQTGWYYVCLFIYDSTGCQSNYCDSIYVNVGTTANCQADFVATSSGSAAAFSNTSTGVNNNTSYLWNFGDGTTSTAMNPTHTYTNTSTTIYYVCLYITTQTTTGVCTDSTCQYLTVVGGGGGSGCQAYFTYGVNGGVVSFQNQSSGGMFYNWDFGNGQISAVMHPTQTYTQTGWYYVCLTIYDTTSCQSTYCDSIYVNVGTTANCQADFVATTSGSTAAFSNTSTGVNNNTSYLWDFGDGTTSTAINPTHTYTNTSTVVYYVCLYITTQTTTGVCTDTTCQSLTILSSGGCQAYFTYGVNGGTVSFQNQSTPSGYFSNWNFGNGQTSSVQHPTQTYTQTGWYYVCLFIYDSTGCQSTYCDSIYVNVGTTTNCQADFVATSVGSMAAFSNTSTGVNNTTSYSWSFGDGTTLTAMNPTHTYTNTSTTIYYVCLYITTQTTTGVCTDSTCQYLTVVGGGGGSGCQAYFTYGVNGGVVSFQNQSTPSGYFSNWNFGNGQTSSVQHPTQTYTQTGWYYVCLFIYDSTGCQSNYCDSIYVNVGTTPNCAAAFTYQMNGTTGGVNFGGIATGTAPYTYTWSFGDGTNSIQQNPTHTYMQSGTYIICLTIVDAIGCIATHCDTLNMTVLAIENAFVSNISALYPNPTQNETSFNIELKEKVNMSVEIVNTIGQSISLQNMGLTSGNHTISLAIENLPQGMYFVKIAAEGQLIATKRLIKE